MNRAESDDSNQKNDHNWDQLYWAHLIVFVVFAALVAWMVCTFYPTFPKHLNPVYSATATPHSKRKTNESTDHVKHPTAQQGDLATARNAPIPSQVAASKPDHWGSGDVVSAMSSFYQTVIAFLIALIGIMGVLAGFTLRALSRAAAEETAHEQANVAMTHYIQSRKFARDVAIAVEEAGITPAMERLEEDMSTMHRRLAQLLESGTDTDDEAAQGQVEQAPGDEEI